MEALEISYICPQEVRSWWGRIKHDIAEVLRENDARVWPEDVYSILLSGRMQLYLGLADGDYRGFAVLFRQENPDGPVLFIWLLKCRNAMKFFPMLEKIAKQAGANRMMFAARRGGWEKLCTRYGFHPAGRIFEREI